MADENATSSIDIDSIVNNIDKDSIDRDDTIELPTVDALTTPYPRSMHGSKISQRSATANTRTHV
jgi:hypothetical protein